jgi:hypothetical protein
VISKRTFNENDYGKEVRNMKRKVSFAELVKKNKEDILKDRLMMAKIEERLDTRRTKSNDGQ